MYGVELDDLENVDNTLNHLIKENYTTFFITNEVAGYSEDLFKKYYNSKDINIIIAKD